MKESSFVAGPGAGIVDFEFGPTPHNGGFVHRDKRAQELGMGVGAGLDRLGHGKKK